MSFLSTPRYFRSGPGENFFARRSRNLSAMSKAELTSHDYANGIATALRDDYGRSASIVKDICEDTGASSGTVKNWLAGLNGPGGEHLIKLQACSPAVRAFVDRLTGRDDIATRTEAKLRRALAVMAEDDSAVVEIVPALAAELAATKPRPPAPIISPGERALPTRKRAGK